MKITKRELIKMKACDDCLKRFIDQTNDTDDSVEVISLIGGENTYGDLLWLAGKKFPKERIVRFACDCALLNIERIKPYTDEYDLIVEFLRNPTDDDACARATAAYTACAAYVTYAAAADTVYVAAAAVGIAWACAAAARAAASVGNAWACAAAARAADAADAASARNSGKVDELLRELFA